MFGGISLTNCFVCSLSPSGCLVYLSVAAYVVSSNKTICLASIPIQVPPMPIILLSRSPCRFRNELSRKLYFNYMLFMWSKYVLCKRAGVG